MKWCLLFIAIAQLLTASPATSSSSSSRVPFSDASNAANGTNGAGDLSASSLIATPAADLVGKSSVELIAHYEAQLQNMRTRMFIGGTKHDEVTDTGYTELGRIKSFSAIRSQAAMGRSTPMGIHRTGCKRRTGAVRKIKQKMAGNIIFENLALTYRTATPSTTLRTGGYLPRMIMNSAM